MKTISVAILLVVLLNACGEGTPCEQWCESDSNCSGGSFEAGGDSCADSCESAGESFHEMGDACGEAFDAYIACAGSSSCEMMGEDCGEQDRAFTDACISAQ